MRARNTVLCAILSVAAFAGFAGTAQAATSSPPVTLAATSTALAGASDVDANAQLQTFHLHSWTDREWTVGKVFATEGSGANTRVVPFAAGDTYPAVGTVLGFNQTLAFSVDRSAFTVRGLSVVLYDKNDPKQTIQVWMKDEWFRPYADAKHPANIIFNAEPGKGDTRMSIWDETDWTNGG